MPSQITTIIGVSVAAILAVCLVLSGIIWAMTAPREKNSGQFLEEHLGPIGLLNDKSQDFPRHSKNGFCDASPVSGTSIPGAERFVTVLNGRAYCDLETDLIWERFPSGSSFDWAGSISHCATLDVGGWKGWSLPIRDQLASLLDIDSILCRGGGLCLPDGHPFQNIQAADYWSASTTAGTPTFGWMINFSFGGERVMKLNAKGLAWCVRGGMSPDRRDLTAIEQPQPPGAWSH